jgi:hypothetical protein
MGNKLPTKWPKDINYVEYLGKTEGTVSIDDVAISANSDLITTKPLITTNKTSSDWATTS